MNMWLIIKLEIRVFAIIIFHDSLLLETFLHVNDFLPLVLTAFGGTATTDLESKPLSQSHMLVMEVALQSGSYSSQYGNKLS